MSSATKRPMKTALHQAILDGRIHQVRLLVHRHGSNIDSKDVYGRTPLMLACLLENDKMASKMTKTLLKSSAYPNARDCMGRTALSYAAMKGREEIVARLLKNEIVDVSTPDNDGNIPLHHAALSGNPAVVDMIWNVMKSYGVIVDSRNAMGYTPLLLACKYGHFASSYILISRGDACPTLRDNEFFFNASEWISRTGDLHNAFAIHRSRTMPLNTAPRFEREHTMYSVDSAPTCRHFTPARYPLGESIDSALKLPKIFQYTEVDERLESMFDGKDARHLLLKAIESASTDKKKSAKPRPFSRVSSVFTQTRIASSIATSRLLHEARRTRKFGSGQDMATLFQLYSDQYDPNVKMRRQLTVSE